MTAARWVWRRRHLFTRDQLNDPNWPHPRPAHDPRLMWGYASLIAVSVLQMVLGVSPTSPQARNDFDQAATLAFAFQAVIAASLILYAAFCPSQYWSFVTELLGCLCMVSTFTLYLWALKAVPNFYVTNTFWWTASVIAGHLHRAAIIGRRFW